MQGSAEVNRLEGITSDLNDEHKSLLEEGKSADHAYRKLVHKVPGKIPTGKGLGRYDDESYPHWDDLRKSARRSLSPVPLTDVEDVST